MTKLSPADLALITQRAALLEAEYVHRTRELHVEINDDDRNTLKMLSVFVALEKTLSRYDGLLFPESGEAQTQDYQDATRVSWDAEKKQNQA